MGDSTLNWLTRYPIRAPMRFILEPFHGIPEWLYDPYKFIYRPVYEIAIEEMSRQHLRHRWLHDFLCWPEHTYPKTYLRPSWETIHDNLNFDNYTQVNNEYQRYLDNRFDINGWEYESEDDTVKRMARLIRNL